MLFWTRYCNTLRINGRSLLADSIVTASNLRLQCGKAVQDLCQLEGVTEVNYRSLIYNLILEYPHDTSLSQQITRADIDNLVTIITMGPIYRSIIWQVVRTVAEPDPADGISVTFQSERIPNRTSHDITPLDNIYRLATATGGLFWSLYARQDLVFEEDEMEAMLLFLKQAYRHLGVDYRGFLPGYIHKTHGRIMCCMPSLQFHLYDPRTTDWLEALWEQNTQIYLTVPVYGAEIPLPLMFPGDEVVAHKGQLAQHMENLMECKAWFEEIPASVEGNKRLLKRMLKMDRDTDRPLYFVTCVKEIPLKFHPFFFEESLLYERQPLSMEI